MRIIIENQLSLFEDRWKFNIVSDLDNIQSDLSQIKQILKNLEIQLNNMEEDMKK